LPILNFTRTGNYYLRESGLISNLLPARYFLKSNSGYSTLATYGLLREISSAWAGGRYPKMDFEILHSTYYRPAYRDIHSARKIVTTLHDFIPEKLGWTGLRNPHIGKKNLCQKADLVVCVSSATQEEAIEKYGVDEKRSIVIHHGVELDPTSTGKQSMDQDPYLLYVGHRQDQCTVN
jgi:glycosyltransferase involved in cell wall biosynthesis